MFPLPSTTPICPVLIGAEDVSSVVLYRHSLVPTILTFVIRSDFWSRENPSAVILNRMQQRIAERIPACVIGGKDVSNDCVGRNR